VRACRVELLDASVDHVDDVDVARRVDVDGRGVDELTVVLALAAPRTQELALGREDDDLVGIVGGNEELLALGPDRDVDGDYALAFGLEFEGRTRSRLGVEHHDAFVALVGDPDFALGAQPDAQRIHQLALFLAHHAERGNARAR
jgi:hypothetical protein